MTAIAAAETTSPSARLAAALEADPQTRQVKRDTSLADQPLIPRMVGFGIHVHQADFGASVPLLAGLEKLFAHRRPILQQESIST